MKTEGQLLWMDGILYYGPKYRKKMWPLSFGYEGILSVTAGAMVDEVLMGKSREEESLR